MGKGGGGGGTQKTVSEPWKDAQPFLRELLGDASGLYGQGQFDIASYGGPRVAPQSDLTQAAMGSFFDAGTGGNPYLEGAASTFPGMTRALEHSDLTQMGQQGIEGMAGGPNPLWGAGMSAFGQNMAGPEAGLGGLGLASEMVDRFGRGDTYRDLDVVKENVLADVIPAVSSRFGDAGMLDSSMAADTISRSAAGAIAPIEYGAWENAQNRALSAYGQAAPMEQGAYESARGRQMQGLGQLPSLMGARYTDPLMAMQAGQQSDQFGLQNRQQVLSALGLAPALNDARYTDPRMMMSAGQYQDQYGQRQADAAMQRYYEEANRPYDELQRAASLGLGFGGMGESRTTNEKQGGGGTMGTIGDIMQFIPMAMMLSDRRVKTDIHRVGETAEGYPTYRFRYLWDDPGVERIGVMADEVPDEITFTDPRGFKWVNYAEVTI